MDHHEITKTRNKVAFVLEHGSEEHKNKLLEHPDINKRMAVVYHGHPDHLDKLMHDKHETVRSEVAKFGSDRHREHLMKDPHPDVRRNVALWSHNGIASRMTRDENKHVVSAAMNQLTSRHLSDLEDDIKHDSTHPHYRDAYILHQIKFMRS